MVDLHPLLETSPYPAPKVHKRVDERREEPSVELECEGGRPLAGFGGRAALESKAAGLALEPTLEHEALFASLRDHQREAWDALVSHPHPLGIGRRPQLQLL